MSFNMNLKGPSGAAVNGMTGGNIIPKGYSRGQLSQFTPEQMQLFQGMFGRVGDDSFLGKLAGGDQSQFDQLEAPALRQFQGLTGNLSSRFSGAGSGARHSSAFQNALSGETQDFASKLHSQRMNYQQQALKDLMEMSNMLLGQKPYEQFLIQNAPKEPSFLKQLGLGLATGIGGLGGSYFGSKF